MLADPQNQISNSSYSLIQTHNHSQIPSSPTRTNFHHLARHTKSQSNSPTLTHFATYLHPNNLPYGNNLNLNKPKIFNNKHYINLNFVNNNPTTQQSKAAGPSSPKKHGNKPRKNIKNAQEKKTKDLVHFGAKKKS